MVEVAEVLHSEKCILTPELRRLLLPLLLIDNKLVSYIKEITFVFLILTSVIAVASDSHVKICAFFGKEIVKNEN